MKFDSTIYVKLENGYALKCMSTYCKYISLLVYDLTAEKS